MAKRYKWIRVYEESAQALDKRLKQINEGDLKAMGIKKAKIPKIEFTKFLFKNPIFISNMELKQMAKKRKSRLC